MINRQNTTPVNNPVTGHGATLGRVLFYDVNLSDNNTKACASCHQQAFAFSDPDQFSLGFDGERTTHPISSIRAYCWKTGSEPLTCSALWISCRKNKKPLLYCIIWKHCPTPRLPT